MFTASIRHIVEKQTGLVNSITCTQGVSNGTTGVAEHSLSFISCSETNRCEITILSFDYVQKGVSIICRYVTGARAKIFADSRARKASRNTPYNF